MGDDCFFCGCGGSAGTTPVVHDGGQTEPEEEIESEPQAPESPVEGPQQVGPPILVDTVAVSGELQALIAGENGCYAVTTVNGNYPNPTISRVVFVSGTDGSTQEVGPLPQAEERSFGWGIPLSGGNMALTYQSTDGFAGQTGDDHGVVVLNRDGGIVADHDFYALGLTRPSALLERGGELLVLANNGSIGTQVEFPDSALVILERPLSQNSPTQIVDLPGYKNASAMALREGQLVIAAADSTLANTGAEGSVVVLDPENLIIESSAGDLVDGIGINGPAAVHRETGTVLLTGQGHNLSRRAIGLYDGAQTTSVSLPDWIEQTYVPGGVFSGDGVLFNISQRGDAETYLIDPATGETQLLQSVPANFPVSPVEYGRDQFCAGAAGTALDADGNFQSEVMFWSVGE